MPATVILGPPALLERCAPADGAGLTTVRIEGPASAQAIAASGAELVLAFDPAPGDLAAAAASGLPTLLWWGGAPAAPSSWSGGPCRTIAAVAPDPAEVWRAVALPVADALFSDAPTDAVAVADGLAGDDGPAREHAARVALARGQLLISEPLEPARGLEPGIDHLEARVPEDVELLADNAARAPAAFARIRLRGRRKAELFRSSAVVGRLVGDFVLELDAVPASTA